eukprot:152147-Rhodomonas_salina.5
MAPPSENPSRLKFALYIRSSPNQDDSGRWEQMRLQHCAYSPPSPSEMMLCHGWSSQLSVNARCLGPPQSCQHCARKARLETCRTGTSR